MGEERRGGRRGQERVGGERRGEERWRGRKRVRRRKGRVGAEGRREKVVEEEEEEKGWRGRRRKGQERVEGGEGTRKGGGRREEKGWRGWGRKEGGRKGNKILLGGGQRRAGLGQALPTGSPVMGSGASSYRWCCGQHTFVQGAPPHAATADDVSDAKVSDEKDYLSRDMTFKANNKNVKEQIWINCVTCEIVFQPLHPRHQRSDRVTTVREEANLHLEFFQQDVTVGTRSPWISCSHGVKSFQEVVKNCAENRETQCSMFEFPSWPALLNEVRHSGAHALCFTATKCVEHIVRKL